LLLVVVAAALRSWMPGPPIFTVDELSWSARSERFAAALADGDLATANVGPADEPATRPGVTTMWVGVLGDELADADPLGLDVEALRWTHVLMGLVCAAMLWPFVVLAARLVGRAAALVAGGVVAVEPLMVGHSAIQHTDALVTMSLAVTAVAMIAAFEAHRAEVASEGAEVWWRRTEVRLAAVAGAFAALGCLTKLSALPILGALVLTLLAVHRRGAAILLTASVAFVLVALLLWPALWVDPVANVRATLGSGELASEPSRHLFLGAAVTGGDWRFYPVELWFRASPWLLLGSAGAAGWAAWRWARRWRPPLLPRRVALPLAIPGVAYVLVITVSEKQYARYLLPLLPFVAIGLGVTAAALVTRLGSPRWTRPVGWGALAVAALFTASLAPYAIAFADPLVGGQRAAEEAIQLGWGEGREVVLAEYLRRAEGSCEPWSATGPWLLDCPRRQDFGWLEGDDAPPRFVLLYIADRQLGVEPPGLRPYLAEHGALIASADVGGVDYAELWELDPG
jgi:hypothetical protein